MTAVAENKDKVVSKKPRKKRPDGMDVTRYEKCEKWSYHQWAWEFLRRNANFIEDCKKVRLGGKGKQAVARKFGLKKFKDFIENYSIESFRTAFSIASPSLWSSLNVSEQKARKIGINLWPGQLIVRLDFAAAIKHEGAIDKQVNDAIRIISKKASVYKTRYQDLTKQHKRKEQTFGIYIRLLDLKAAGKTHLECGEILLKNKMQGTASPDDFRDDIKQRLKAARKMANEDYKYLSVREGCPTEGTVIPIEVQG